MVRDCRTDDGAGDDAAEDTEADSAAAPRASAVVGTKVPTAMVAAAARANMVFFIEFPSKGRGRPGPTAKR